MLRVLVNMQCERCEGKLGFLSSYYPDNSKYTKGVCKKCYEEIKKEQEEEGLKPKNNPDKVPEIKKGLPFLLEKNEKLIKDAASVAYSGVAYINQGHATGLGSSLSGGAGLGTAFYSSKQVKREGSIWDAKTAHLYITNKRIIFVNAKIGFFDNVEKSIGMPFAEIYFKSVKGINIGEKLNSPAIDVAVANKEGNIDNIKFWFLKDEKRDTRNAIFKLLTKQVEK